MDGVLKMLFMARQEAKFTTKFRRWAAEHVGTGAYEIKHTRGKDYFYCAELAEHQADALKAAKGPHGLAFKIPDEGYSYRPFDMFVLKGTPAWVVIVYPGVFMGIDIDTFLTWKEKSLSYEQAIPLASFISPISAL